MKIELSKPITAHGEELTSIDLREPVGEDVMVCGYPLSIGDGSATPIPETVGKLIARLAGIPPSSVKQMALVDFQSAMGVILGFFGESPQG